MDWIMIEFNHCKFVSALYYALSNQKATIQKYWKGKKDIFPEWMIVNNTDAKWELSRYKG